MYTHIYIYMETQKKCSKCNLLKNLDDFYITQRGHRCKECILIETRNYKRKKRLDPEHRIKEGLKQKERRVRLWQNTLLHDSKHRKLEHTLTVSEINHIFEKQNGLCYWFNVPLLPSNKKNTLNNHL